MGVQNVMRLTLGEWSSICAAWSKAHAHKGDSVKPPTAEEFEVAVLAARGVMH